MSHSTNRYPLDESVPTRHAVWGLAGLEIRGAAANRAELSLTVRGRDLHLTGPGFSPGNRGTPGERVLIDAFLIGENDEEIGRFLGIYVALDPAIAPPATSIEQHTFEFADGTISGTGRGTSDHNVADQFAIVGGKGRYLDATGYYTALQRHLELGGDGTADYDFRLLL